MKATTSADFFANPAFLLANSEAYERLVEKVQAMDLQKEAEAMLEQLAFTEVFAARYHPGRFADGAIENLALKIGAELSDLMTEVDGFAIPVVRKDGRRRVLHVTSEVEGVGGHTRMLYHWMRNDQSSCHSLVLIDQRNRSIPCWLSELVQHNGGQLVVLPQRSRLCQKAKWLRELARLSADLVVLHRSEAMLTVAFAVPDCPPVVLVNAADHVFWMGGSVLDLVINMRSVASQHTAERRFVSSNMVLPIPLLEPAHHISSQDAKRALGISEDQVVLLSVGRGEKYRPCGPYDFVATAGKILDSCPNAHLFVVGESIKGIAPYLRCRVHDRLHFLGSIEDPSLYRTAADVYLESFPFGSQTALLEAALSGLPIVPAYAPLFPLLVANDDAVLDLLPNPRYEQEYIEKAELFIRQPRKRIELGETLRKRLFDDHVGKCWLDRLTEIYQKTDCIIHSPQTIPISICMMTGGDIGLSLYNVVSDGKTSSIDNSGDGMLALQCHTASLAKDIGDYAKARRLAWLAVRYEPFRRASWRLLLVTLLGRTGRLIRRMFLTH
ncbi:MAG: hypothetical protein ACXW1U_10010 [Methylobacter sp.]